MKAGGLLGEQALPQAVSDGTGGLIVAWRNSREVIGRFGRQHLGPVLIEGQRFSGEGLRLWGRGGRILHDTRFPQQSSYYLPALVLVPDGQDGAILACDSAVNSPQNPATLLPAAVVAQRLAPSGRLLWGGGIAVAAEPMGQILNDLVPGPDGGAFLAIATKSRPNRTLLYRLGPSGESLWPGGVPVADPDAIGADDDEMPARAAFDGEHLRVMWTHYPGELIPSSEIRATTFDLAGNRLGAPGGEILTPATAWNLLQGFAWNRESHRGLAVWNRSAAGGADVHANGALCDETCGSP